MIVIDPASAFLLGLAVGFMFGVFFLYAKFAARDDRPQQRPVHYDAPLYDIERDHDMVRHRIRRPEIGCDCEFDCYTDPGSCRRLTRR